MHFPRTVSARWLDIIANYDFTIRHRKSIEHADVDYLSHMGASTIPNGIEIDDDDDDVEINIPIQAIQSNDIIATIDINESQKKDEYISTVKHWLENKVEPKRSDVSKLSTACQRYSGILKALKIKEGMLVRVRQEHESEEVDKYRPCIPEKIIEKNNLFGSCIF